MLRRSLAGILTALGTYPVLPAVAWAQSQTGSTTQEDPLYQDGPDAYPPSELAPEVELQGDGGWEGDVFDEDAPDGSLTEAQISETLDAQGRWLQVPGYGRVWRPYGVSSSWRPYSSGRWEQTNGSWLWVSTFSWGWIPFHYGRWVRPSGFGWVWVPGYRWAPAWVVWSHGSSYAGWAPLPPRARWNGTLYVGAVPSYAWVYCPVRAFRHRSVHFRPVYRRSVYRQFRTHRSYGPYARPYHPVRIGRPARIYGTRSRRVYGPGRRSVITKPRVVESAPVRAKPGRRSITRPVRNDHRPGSVRPSVRTRGRNKVDAVRRRKEVRPIRRPQTAPRVVPGSAPRVKPRSKGGSVSRKSSRLGRRGGSTQRIRGYVRSGQKRAATMSPRSSRGIGVSKGHSRRGSIGRSRAVRSKRSVSHRGSGRRSVGSRGRGRR
ncbi:MAG: DUF6600 domain-containing protein [Myxococcota bacterium]